MHRTRNCNNICNPFCNDITNFKENNNKNIKCTSYKIGDCEKSYESCFNICNNNVCDNDEDSLSLYSTSSSDESCSSDSETYLTSNCKKEKCKSQSLSTLCDFKLEDYKCRPRLPYNDNYSHKNYEESIASESTVFKPKLRKSTILSKLSEIKYKIKSCETDNSVSDESTKISSKESSKTCSKESGKTCSKESSKTCSKESNKTYSKESTKTVKTKASKDSVSKSEEICNNNCDEESNLCNIKNTHKKTNKYLKLTDAFSRNTEGGVINVSISNHGKYVYAVYNMNSDCSGNNIAEIFENKNGKLITKKVLDGDNDFPLVSGGYASPNFNKFSILDDDQMSVARLRILDSKFNNLVSATFNDYYSKGNSFRGGKFIDNGKYVAVTYVYSSDSEDRQKSVLRILRTDTLEQAYEFKFVGNTYSNIKYFKLKNSCGECETYIVLLTNDGVYNTARPHAKSFSVLKILKLDSENNKIKLIDQALLPQIGDFDLIENNNKIYIAVGTLRADINKNKTIFNLQSKSLLVDNGDELRVYIFGDNKLELLYSKNLDTCVKVLFHPNKDSILIQQNNFKLNGLLNSECSESDNFNNMNDIASYPGFFNINSLHINNCDVAIANSYVTRTAPNNFVAEFSKNGKWLIVTGSKENADGLDVYGIKNVQLFNVSLP